MDKFRQPDYTDPLIDIGKHIDLLRSALWKILSLSVGVGVAVLIWTLQKPNLYCASTIVLPAIDESKTSSPLGSIIPIGLAGGNSKVEDLEALFISNDLTVRVFKKYNIFPIVKPERIDQQTGLLKPSWKDRLTAFWEKGSSIPRYPDDWDAIRAARAALSVSINRKNGHLSLSFESPSAEGSASIVRYYIEEAKSRLQEEALSKASMNKKFIEEQINKTHDVLTRDRLYSLYGKEIENEMMARNREQFGFRVIDAPRKPDRKSSPHRIQIAIFTTILSSIFWSLIFIFFERIRLKQGKLT